MFHRVEMNLVSSIQQKHLQDEVLNGDEYSEKYFEAKIHLPVKTMVGFYAGQETHVLPRNKQNPARKEVEGNRRTHS